MVQKIYRLCFMSVGQGWMVQLPAVLGNADDVSVLSGVALCSFFFFTCLTYGKDSALKALAVIDH